MCLVNEEIARKVPYVKGINVLRIEALVDRVRHLSESLGEQVLGVPVVEDSEIGHSRTDHGHTST
jgi:hypothetical protein